MPRCRGGVDRERQAVAAADGVSRRAALAGGPAALAAAFALGACSSDRGGELVSVRAPQAGGSLHALRDAPWVIVAGERLDIDLLRGFYARHDFERVWASRPAQADALVDAVLRSGEHGLDPELFHASLLQRRETFPSLRRELLLTHACLTYARALAFGAVPPGRRKDGEALTPGPVDVAAVLDAAIASADPPAVIEALAPATPSYRALRQALQTLRAGTRGGGAATTNRLRQVEVNLERQRWLPRPLPADRVWVNVADQRLVLYRADEPVFSARVVVGQDAEHNQSPEFRADIEASFFNPPWVIPRDIVSAEILPLIQRDPTYLVRNNMVMRPNGEIEQLPGPNAGLGLVMFDMPNRFDVYLHDTPDRHLFNRDNRRISHGCIRVQNPLELAALLMQQPVTSFEEVLAMGSTTRKALPAPVPVFVTYQTAFADTDGKLQFRPDFYNRDADLWQRLHMRREERDLPLQADRRPPSPGPG